MARERLGHGLFVLLPQRCAAFNVAEEKRHRPAGQRLLRHLRGRGQRGQVEPVGGQSAAGGLHKGPPRIRHQRQLLGQPFGQLARRPARVGLELADGIGGTADPRSQLGLRQVAGFAPAPESRAERCELVHGGLLPAMAAGGWGDGTETARFLSCLLYRKP